MSVLLNHWFIADLHLGHRNIITPGWDDRPFDTIEDHDETLTANCAAEGTSGRTLWILGDVAFRQGHLKAFLERVMPHWHRVVLIRGNHDDRVAWRLRDLFSSAHEAFYERARDKEAGIDVRFYMSHYAHRVWRNSNHGSYHIHGHSHGHLRHWGRSIDVGANCVGYKPISLEEVVRLRCSEAPVNHHIKETKEPRFL